MELTLAEIKERVDSAKEQYPYPDFHGEPLIALMELYNQQQAEIERLRAALQEVIDLSYTTFPVPGMREIAIRGLAEQKPEAPQESLKVQILRYLATVKESHYYQICHHVPSVNMDVIGEMEREGLIYHKQDKRNYYYISQITAAGRDYLASLDKPELTDAEIDARINEQERLRLESIDYGSDDNSIDIYPDEDYGDWGGGGLFD